MHCLILAAGYATRLSPLTDNFPKPLLDIKGKSILDWLLDDLEKNASIDKYIVISNHKYAGHFTKWAESRPGRITVVDDGTSTNETRLGAVRDMEYAMQETGIQDDMFVMAGDNLLDFSLAPFLDYFHQKKASCIMRYEEPDIQRLKKCGVITLDNSDRVLSMVEKPSEPPSHWCVPPFYCYTKEDIALLPRALNEGCGADAPGSFAAWIAGNSTLYAMPMPGKRKDIGNLTRYLEANK